MSMYFLSNSYSSHILFLFLFVTGLLIAPFVVFSAYNDLTLTTDAVVTFNGLTLNISGSSATLESIVVTDTDFVVTLQSGSTLTVSSSDRKRIDITSLAQVTSSDTCTASASTRTFSTSASTTVYIVPSSAACDASSSGGSSGGGGGGGGIVGSGPLSVSPQGVSTQPATTTPASTAPGFPSQPSQTTQPSLGATSPSSVVFNQSLILGMSHPDVNRLQILLNTDPDTRVTENGPGSTGNESSYFGNLTQKAVQKFQIKHNIVQAGMPGFGTVGPKTRIKLQEVFGAAPAPTTVIPPTSTESPAVTVKTSSPFTRLLYGGVTHPEVKRLQILLNSDPDTRIAESGVGSPGQETEHFGILTERAVQKFQAKHGVISSGTPGTTGYGWVGPKTRLKLQEIFGSQ